MNLEKLDQEAEHQLNEARALAERIHGSIDSLNLSARVNQHLRTRLVEEIETRVNRILEDVDKRRMEIEEFSYFHRNETVWVRAIVAEDWSGVSFDFSAVTMDRDMGVVFAAKIESEHPNSKYMRTNDFENRVNSLKTGVLKGEMDLDLGTKVEEALWKYVFKAEMWR